MTTPAVAAGRAKRRHQRKGEALKKQPDPPNIVACAFLSVVLAGYPFLIFSFAVGMQSEPVSWRIVARSLVFNYPNFLVMVLLLYGSVYCAAASLMQLYAPDSPVWGRSFKISTGVILLVLVGILVLSWPLSEP